MHNPAQGCLFFIQEKLTLPNSLAGPLLTHLNLKPHYWEEGKWQELQKRQVLCILLFSKIILGLPLPPADMDCSLKLNNLLLKIQVLEDEVGRGAACMGHMFWCTPSSSAVLCLSQPLSPPVLLSSFWSLLLSFWIYPSSSFSFFFHLFLNVWPGIVLPWWLWMCSGSPLRNSAKAALCSSSVWFLWYLWQLSLCRGLFPPHHRVSILLSWIPMIGYSFFTYLHHESQGSSAYLCSDTAEDLTRAQRSLALHCWIPLHKLKPLNNLSETCPASLLPQLLLFLSRRFLVFKVQCPLWCFEPAPAALFWFLDNLCFFCFKF